MLGLEQVEDAGDDDVVRAREDREADTVNVLLDGGGDDHLGGLAEAGVDDLHPGVAEGAGDDFCAAVVAVQAGFGYENANWGICHANVSIRFGLEAGVPPSPPWGILQGSGLLCWVYDGTVSVRH